MKFSDRLKQIRKELNLTQEEFGKSIGKSRSTVAGYETDRKEPGYEVLIRISKHYNVTIDYLLGNSEIESLKYDSRIRELISVSDNLTNEQLKLIIGIMKEFK